MYILHFLNQKAFSDQKSKEFDLNFTITSKWNVVYYLWQNIWNKVTKSKKIEQDQKTLLSIFAFFLITTAKA